MWPKAKLDYFSVIQRDDGGLEVTDPKTGTVETLDALTALVLAFSDGKTSTDAILAELRACFDGEIDAETVWSAYDRLRDSGLIEDWSVPPAGPGILSRRHVIGRLGGAVAAASIAAVIGGQGARAQSPQEQEKAAKIQAQQEKAAKRSQEQKAKAAQEQGKKSPAAQEKMKKAQEKQQKAAQEKQKKSPAQEKQQKAAQEKQQKAGTQEKKKKSAQEQQKKKATAEKKQKSGTQEKKQKAAQEQQQKKAAQEQAAKRAQEQKAKAGG